MIDIGKVEEKNRLAKLLVEQRLAASFDDAVKQIESAGFTETEGERKAYGDMMVKDQTPQPQSAAAEQHSNQNVDKILRKIDYLTQHIQSLTKAVAELQQHAMKQAQNRPQQQATAPQATKTSEDNEQTTIESHEPQQEPQKSTSNENHPQKDIMNDPSQFAVENIFSNAHGKMNLPD